MKTNGIAVVWFIASKICLRSGSWILSTAARVSAWSNSDFLLVFTSGCHRDALLEIVKSDKHVFVEKPVAYSLKETEEVAQAARGRRGQLMIGYHKRFDPAYLGGIDVA